ncbi:MAG: DUF2341 domain-containing protein [Archaeoglobaceae archaeon]
MPQLENNTETNIYMYYGNPTAVSRSNSTTVFSILNPSFEEIYDDGTCDRASFWDFDDASTSYSSDGWLRIVEEPVSQGKYSWGIKWTGNSFNNRAHISQDTEMFQSMKLTLDILGPSYGYPYRSNHKIFVDDNLIKNCGYVTNGQKKTCSVDLIGYKGLHNLKLTWEQRTGDNLGNSKIDNIILRKYASPEPSVEVGNGTMTSSLPNLSVSSGDIEFSSGLVLNKSISVTASVKNTGEINATNVSVQFFEGSPLSGPLIGEQVLTSIAAGGEEIAKANWTLDGSGAQDLYVIVDPHNVISEQSESNNVAFKSVIVPVCPSNPQQKLFSALNSEFSGHGYDFYEEYYNFNDNASKRDSLKTCYTELEDDDIWINYLSSDSRGFYPCSAYLFGPKIGVDTNNWYDGGTPVRGFYYPELELEIIDDWVHNTPFAGENKNAENFLWHLLEANKCGFESDGVYSQGNITYNEDTNRSIVTTKFSGRFAKPGGLIEGGDCQAEFDKYYDVDMNQFGDDLEDLSCNVDLDIPSTEAGLGKNVSCSFGLFKFDGEVKAGAKLSPTASGGSRLSLDPQCLVPAGSIQADFGLDAKAQGKLCLASRCYDIESSLPIPSTSIAEFTGEAVIPNEEFASDDKLRSLYSNPDGSYVTYKDLDNLNPVFRVATSEIDVEYDMNIDLNEMGIPCGKSLPFSPPCNIRLYDGSLFHIDPWQHYWGFTEVTVHSPVELHLYDSLGRHVGSNGSGKVELNIPNSTYIERNGTKTIRFPTEVGKFTLFLNGTDNGDYTLNISRPVMIETENGNTTIKGVDYGINDVSTFIGKEDYYNIDFIQIERRINEMVGQGLNIDAAVEGGSDLIVGVKNATKLPSSLHSEDVVSYNGEKVTLNAQLNSLNKSISNETVIFTLDGETIGSNVTNNEGEAILDYSVPHDAGIGAHKVECVFNGSDSYYNSTATAHLEVLNKRPQANINVTDFPSGTAVINGSITGSNIENVSLKIDDKFVSGSIPYLWDTSEYSNGYHRIELVANDSLGSTGKAINYVFVHNPIADPGGPYKGLEGHRIQLNGSGSYDLYDEITSWSWNLDDDSIPEKNATEKKGITNHTWGDDYSGNVSLHVKDDSGGTDSISTRVVVDNVAPTVEAGASQEVTAGDAAYFNGSFSDPGWLDEHTISWNFEDWCNSTSLETVHTFYQKGSYDVNLTVEDDDGGVGKDSTKVIVNPIPVNITIKPEVINPKSKGKFTAFIGFPEEYNISQVDPDSITCNNNTANWVNTTECNATVAKFEKEELNTTVGNEIRLVVEGEVFHNGGYADFEGNDTVSLKGIREKEREREQERNHIT